jgi:hypothetical protein
LHPALGERRGRPYSSREFGSKDEQWTMIFMKASFSSLLAVASPLYAVAKWIHRSTPAAGADGKRHLAAIADLFGG